MAVAAPSDRASAAAYVNDTGYWQFLVVGLPSGVTLSCYGTASEQGSTGCTDTRTLTATATTSEQLSISDISGIVLTNSTENPFPLSNTTFNSEAGCSIYAAVYDVSPGQSTNVEATCFVDIPDLCSLNLSLPELIQYDLLPSQSIVIPADINLTADFTFIPEPATIALFVAGLLGLAAVVRRKRPQASQGTGPSEAAGGSGRADRAL